MSNDKILNVVLCALVNDGKILLIKRNKEPYKDHWGLVGGKMEFGEHIEETAKREVKEETGLDAEVIAVRGVATEIVHTKEGADSHFIIYVVELKPKNKELVECEEGELKWFKFDELKDLNIIPSDKLMFEEFVLKKKELKVQRIKVQKDGDRYDVEEFL
jgi:8-oxo-dGTP diphosphatase